VIRITFAALMALISVSAGAAPVPAGKAAATPTEMPVHAKSLVVVHLQGFDRVKDKATAFVKAAFPKDGEALAKKMNDNIVTAMEGRQLKSLTKDGRIYFAIHSFTDFEDNPFAFVVPVDDPKAFVAGVFPKEKVESREKAQGGYEKIESDGETYYVIEKSNQVIIAGNEEIAKLYNGPFETLKTKFLGDAVGEAFFKSDASLFVNIEEVNDQYGEQIAQFRQFFNLIFEQGAIGGAPGMDKREMEMIKQVYGAAFQMLDDGKAVVLAGELAKDGAYLRLLGRFAPDSTSAKFVVQEKPTPLATLGELPKGFANYSAWAFGPQMAKPFAKIAREITAGEGDEAGQVKLDAWSELAAGSTLTTMAMNFDRTGVTLIQNPNAEKTVAAMVAAYQSLGEGANYQNIPLKGKPAVAERDQTYRDITFHKITIKVDFEEAAKQLPEEAREGAIVAFKQFLPETTTFWIGSKGNQIAQVAAKDWASAKSFLDDAFDKKSPATSDASIKQTREALPADVSFVTMLDATRTINFMGSYFGSIMGSMPGLVFGDQPLPKLATVKADPCYAGLTLTLKGDSFALTAYTPIKAVSLVREAVEPLLGKDD
jgi:hypothetical protein